jgi:hypothetical protein
LGGFFKFFFALRKIKRTQKIGSVLEVNPEKLKQQGIKVLVLDFDGVLASHGEFRPKPEVQAWLKQAVKSFGLGEIFILTNNPRAEREAFFKTNFPEVEFIYGRRKKPYPDGLLKIQAKSGIAVGDIVLVDDRLLTGMLACEIAGVKGIFIRRPYRDFTKRPLTELGFFFLRWIEQFLLF